MNVIPKHTLLCRTLSQCLNPVLPTGVHKKVIEVYEAIFNIILPKSLGKGLAVYSFGLFSFFPVSSMQTKPILLDIFENYFLPLKEDLIPCFPSFINCLLYGIEEEGSEIYKKSVELLEKLREIDDKSVVISLWKSILFCKEIRRMGFSYVIIVQKKELEKEYILMNRKELVLNSIISSLIENDENSISQKSALDTIFNIFPLFVDIFTKNEKIKLMYYILLLLKKKDAQLNRRIFLLVFNQSNFNEIFYQKNVMSIVLETVQDLLKNNENVPAILTGLAEKLPKENVYEILYRSVGNLIEFIVKNNEKNENLCVEMVKLFDEKLVGKIWDVLIKKIEKTTNGELFFELKSNFKSFVKYYPKFNENARKVNLEDNWVDFTINYFKIIQIRFEKVSKFPYLESFEFLQYLFCGKTNFSSENLTKLYEMFKIVFISSREKIILSNLNKDNFTKKDRCSLLKIKLSFLKEFLFKIIKNKLNDYINIREIFEFFFSYCLCKDMNISIFAIKNFVSVILDEKLAKIGVKFDDYISKIIKQLWGFLDFRNTFIHFEIVKKFIVFNSHFHVLFQKEIYELIMCKKIVGFQRFSFLWNLVDELNVNPNEFLYKSFFLLLDGLKSSDPIINSLSNSFVIRSLRNISRVLFPLMKKLIFVKEKKVHFKESEIESVFEYIIQIRNVNPEEFFKQILITKIPTEYLSELKLCSDFDDSLENYFSLICSVSVILLSNENFKKKNVQKDVTLFLSSILIKGKSSKFVVDFTYYIFPKIIEIINTSILTKNYMFQFELMKLMYFIIHILHEEYISDNESITEDDQKNKKKIHRFVKIIKSDQILEMLISSLQNSRLVNFPLLFKRWSENIISLVPFFRLNFSKFSKSILEVIIGFLEELSTYSSLDLIKSQYISECIKVMFFVINYSFKNFLKSDEKKGKTITGIEIPFVGIDPFDPFGLKPIFGKLFNKKEEEVIKSSGEESVSYVLSNISNISKTLIKLWMSCSIQYNSKLPVNEQQLGITDLSDYCSISKVINNQIISIFQVFLQYFPVELMISFMKFHSKIHVEIKNNIIINFKSEDKEKVNYAMFSILNSFKLDKKNEAKVVELIIDTIETIRERKKSLKLFDHQIVAFLHDYVYYYLEGIENCEEVEMIKIFSFIKMNISTNLFDIGLFLQIMFNYKNKCNNTKMKKLVVLEKEICQKMLEVSLQLILKEVKKQEIINYNHVVVQVLVLLIKVSPLIFDLVFRGKETNNINYSILMAIHQNIVQILRLHRIENMVVIEKMAEFVGILSNHQYLSIRAVRKNLTEYFNDKSFFRLHSDYLKTWRDVFKKGVLKEKSLYDLINKIPNYQLKPALFVNKNSDSVLRAKIFKRISFIIFINGHSNDEKIIKKIFEIFKESLKFSNFSRKVVQGVLFCLRIILLRTTDKEISIFLCSIIFQLIHLFLSEKLDNEILYEAVKFFDFFYVVKPQIFFMFQWIFYKDPEFQEFDSKIKFKPFLHYFVGFKKRNSFVDTEKYPEKEKKIPLEIKKKKEIGNEEVIEYIMKVISLNRQKYLQKSLKNFNEQEVENMLLEEFSELTNEEFRFIKENKKNYPLIPSTKKNEVDEKNTWVFINLV